MCLVEARNRSGNAHRPVAAVMHFERVVSVFIKPHLRMRRQRSLLSKIDRSRLAAGETNDHKAPTPDVTRGGMSYSQSKPGRDGRINCITACSQNIRTNLTRNPLLRGDHPTI